MPQDGRLAFGRVRPGQDHAAPATVAQPGALSMVHTTAPFGSQRCRRYSAPVRGFVQSDTLLFVHLPGRTYTKSYPREALLEPAVQEHGRRGQQRRGQWQGCCSRRADEPLRLVRRWRRRRSSQGRRCAAAQWSNGVWWVGSPQGDRARDDRVDVPRGAGEPSERRVQQVRFAWERQELLAREQHQLASGGARGGGLVHGSRVGGLESGCGGGRTRRALR